MNKQNNMYIVKRQLATMHTIKTDHGDIDISSDLTVLSMLEKLLFRHLKKVVDEAFESGEQLDWLKNAYDAHKVHIKAAHAALSDKESAKLTDSKKGVSLDGEVVLDNPRPTGDGKINAKSPKK